ncbi:hypothetical protein LOTGIDRAFT_126759 [Lottia gigantea]|uniref:DEP domain-containing protein n=1 Tax=Lottia gigantea TaxID=225164 RepID=V3ZAM0_LOTGI|nr:hypothetical protein LOTGIDRAFT_126759 [Lottia gigantea]ESO88023.1 hypothetical protein LOTGIDRAFT_126759 [Lottia gigantea]
MSLAPIISNNATNGTSTQIDFDNLYPAILQCFVIILFGYIAGRVGVITSSQGKGIGAFVSKFCLPALLFQNMCQLKFSEVNWYFLGSIVIAKTCVFIIVAVITLVVKRPLNLGCAGLYAIFCTQSNDFALGYPILQALYSETNPSYLQYIYLIAPISLVFLNPIGFTLMEIHNNQHNHKHSNKVVIFHVFKGVVTNPIVFMTAIGIIGNVVFKQKVPYIIDDILQVLGNAFSASALFYLGLNLVGKLKGQLGIAMVVPILLIAAKSILLPLLTWEVIGWLETSQSLNESSSLGMYGFLYGTFPTAPSVFLYASQYNVAQDLIATSMVAGTFVSAPLMFVSAKMMTVVVESELDYKSLLLDTSFDTSILSIVCCLWVFGVLFASGRWRRIPHRFLFCLIIMQLLSSIGMVVYSKNHTSLEWQNYVQFILLLLGVFGVRCFTGVIAVVLCLLHIRSLCYVLRVQIWLFIYGFGFPLILTGLLFLIGRKDLSNEIDPSFHYGFHQTLLSVVVLSVNVVIVIIALTIKQRNDRLTVSSAHLSLSKDNGHEEEGGNNSGEKSSKVKENMKTSPDSDKRAGSVQKSYQSCNSSTSVPKEHPLFDTLNERTCLLQDCGPTQRRQCISKLRKYMVNSAALSDDPQIEAPALSHEAELNEYQSSQHLILILLLLLSMLVGLFLCVWKLFNTKATGIYVEIEFLDGVFNYGQGFLIFTVFGFDTKLIFSRIMRRLRRCIYGVEIVHLPKKSDLDEETVNICQQFEEYHKKQCSEAILKNLRYRLRTYRDVFTGTDLCDWLIQVGLAHTRHEALEYGRHLIMGRILAHVTGEHFFHDQPYFYRFISTEDDNTQC